MNFPVGMDGILPADFPGAASVKPPFQPECKAFREIMPKESYMVS